MSVSVLVHDDTVEAHLGDADVTARGNDGASDVQTGERDNDGDRTTEAAQGLAVTATSFEDVTAIALGASVGSSVGIGGSVTVGVLTENTQAWQHIVDIEPLLAKLRDDGYVIAALEQRLSQVENATERVEGSAGRADNLLIAAAARRAIDRGVALGYLEKLLVERFGERHRAAVATIVTGARNPVRLNDLIASYEALGRNLRRGGPDSGWWSGLKRELGSIVEVHSSTRPSLASDARYERALRRLQSGDVDEALAETMRMPGATQANAWVGEARRYIAVHRALDEIESAALMPRPGHA